MLLVATLSDQIALSFLLKGDMYGVRGLNFGLDVPSVDTADLKEGLGDLTQRGAAYCAHEGLEDVVSAQRPIAQIGQGGGSVGCVPSMEVSQPLDLTLFLL